MPEQVYTTHSRYPYRHDYAKHIKAFLQQVKRLSETAIMAFLCDLIDFIYGTPKAYMKGSTKKVRNSASNISQFPSEIRFSNRLLTKVEHIVTIS